MEAGSVRVRKCVRRPGTSVGKRWNQKVESRVRRVPFEGIPCRR